MIRTIKRIERDKLAGTILVVLLILLLPVLVPIGLIQHHIQKRRMRKAIRNFTCISCGAKLGERSVQLADEHWSIIMADLQARYPNARFRVVRDLDAICPRCGCEYMYRDANRELILRQNASHNSLMPILRRSLQDPEPLMQKAAARELNHWKSNIPGEAR